MLTLNKYLGWVGIEGRCGVLREKYWEFKILAGDAPKQTTYVCNHILHEKDSNYIGVLMTGTSMRL